MQKHASFQKKDGVNESQVQTNPENGNEIDKWIKTTIRQIDLLRFDWLGNKEKDHRNLFNLDSLYICVKGFIKY